MNFGQIQNALVIAPHTDDGELGAGGLISKLVRKGVNVSYVAFSTASESLASEFPKDALVHEVKAAVNALGIAEKNLTIFDYEVRKLNYRRQDVLEDLVGMARENTYDLVLVPSIHDVHQDHATVTAEAIRAFKRTSILGYELIWNTFSFNGQCFVKLAAEDVQAKIDALKHYKTQEGRPYMAPDFQRGLARARGVQCGSEFAECFEVIRWVIK